MRTDLRRRRITVTGWINLNVVDGSAFFLPALATCLAGDPFTDVTLVSAVPLRREEIVAEVRDLPNVRVLDPWAAVPRDRWREYEMASAAGTREGFARLLADRDRAERADVVVVRDTHLADALLAVYPEIAARLVVYVTGVTFAGQETDPEVVDALDRSARAGVAAFALQTDAMRERFHELVPACEPSRSLVLRPMVAGSAVAAAEPVAADAVPTRLVYTGKFAAGWNTRPMVACFRAARRAEPRLTLTMVGDQVQPDPEDEGFAEDMRRLLESDDVWWPGAVPRRVSRALIRQHDVGISWRAPHMDQSLELSTKLLEYGVLGRPCIINRNPMHERIFGSDYPYYANSATEFLRQLETLAERPDEYREAARRVQGIAAGYTYERSRERLTPVLDAISGTDASTHPLDVARPVGEWLRVEDLAGAGALSAVGARGRFAPGSGGTGSGGLEAVVGYLADAELVRRGHRAAEDAADAALAVGTEEQPACEGAAQDLAVGRLKQQLEQQRALRTQAEERLAALRSSRLGSLQTRYWALRSKGRR